ncbi:MAG: hypothetical protein IPM29_15790 [Planctomycetes bacterium]|nr:hypothetical protein [Planctomycetota bacterium]
MLSLDELASDWQRPERETDFSLPALVNFVGMVQAAWGVAGVQNWICPPTGIATPLGLLFERFGERVRRVPRDGVAYRWKAYEIERRGHGVASAVRMPAGRDAVIVRLRFERAGTFALAFGGLPRVWRFTDYWNLPPEDVPMLNVVETAAGFRLDDTKTFGAADIAVPGRRGVWTDLQAWLDGELPCARGRVGIAELTVAAGDEVVWTGVQGCEQDLAPLDVEAGWDDARRSWEHCWEAAFTPDNDVFSGHLPWCGGALERLYAMGVLSLLQTRRLVRAPTPRSLVATGGQCIWSESAAAPGRLESAYVALGPEGGMTTSFLWELTFQAPLLARLDPAVLRAQLEAMMRVDLHRHWGLETVSGQGAGMEYGVNAGGLLSCVADYVRVTGDRAWALRHLPYLRSCARPGLTDYGACQNILECVSTYEHRIAAFNALNVQAMRFLAALTGEARYAHDADALAGDVLALYAGGPFACLQPDGSRRVVATILDFVYVGRCMTADLPAAVRDGMVAFFERELVTADWCRALSPRDPDALTRALPSFQTFRADHQATGAYDGWPALAASVLLRFGRRDRALEWLRAIQELTREGPFGQAHYVHPDGRARKASFHNGNCWFAAAGCAFATLLLEEGAGPG